MTNTNDALIYLIAVTLIPGIGNMNAKKLIAWCGKPETVFKEPRSSLMKIPGMGRILKGNVNFRKLLSVAEKEVNFILNNGITPLYYYDDEYPERLKQCADSP